MNRKVSYFSFLLHQKSCKKIKNSRKSIYLKIGKNWNVFLDGSKNLKKIHFFDRENFFSFFSNFQVNRFSQVFNFFTWFLMQKKAEISYFTIQKFFTPLTNFYPTFVTSKVEHIWVVNMKSEQTSRLKRWGTKTSEGGKNFWIFSSSIAAFICTKNH